MDVSRWFPRANVPCLRPAYFAFIRICSETRTYISRPSTSSQRLSSPAAVIRSYAARKLRAAKGTRVTARAVDRIRVSRMVELHHLATQTGAQPTGLVVVEDHTASVVEPGSDGSSAISVNPWSMISSRYSRGPTRRSDHPAQASINLPRDRRSSTMVLPSAGPASTAAMPKSCEEFPWWLHTYNHTAATPHSAANHPPPAYLTSQVSTSR
jgi:hypothetical protein